MSPQYRGSTAEPVDVAPLDPDGVQDYDMDWGSTTNADPWLASTETISQSTWTVPASLGKGDGIVVVASEAGNVTPAAPSIESSSKVARVWLYVVSAKEGSEHIIENTIRTSAGRVESRSMRLKVMSK